MDETLQTALYGQQIAHRAIVSALNGHARHKSPKALSMSFHGPPGTGKTFVAKLIAETVYEKGTKSNYFHFFNGRNDFPLQRKVEEYKESLRNSILSSLQECERSIFVFDEVDKMPEGLLDVLVPFLDYSPSHRLKQYLGEKLIDKTQAIYIFLSNTGSTQIVQRLLRFWQDGNRREDLALEDFENLISIGAFNEKGGFYYSDTIEASLIDHYIPFLPLEEVHVRKCLESAFRERAVEPTESLLQTAMRHVTFGPEPHNLYSSSGCKRLEQKVSAIVYRTL